MSRATAATATKKMIENFGSVC